MTTAAVVVHHLQNSRSQRVLWLLEELEVPYEVRRYERNRRTLRAPPELRAIHPLGKSPVVTLSEAGRADRVLAETGAIVETLVERFAAGRLAPPDDDSRLRVRYWMHHAEGSAIPPQVMALVLDSIPKGLPRLLRRPVRALLGQVRKQYLQPELDLYADHWEDALGAGPWFGGAAFTAADVMMSFPVETGAKAIGYLARPRLRAFLERIHARPAYRRALERGGEYAYA